MLQSRILVRPIGCSESQQAAGSQNHNQRGNTVGSSPFPSESDRDSWLKLFFIVSSDFVFVVSEDAKGARNKPFAKNGEQASGGVML